MNITLRYFSGTGNSFKIINACRDFFVEAGHSVTISDIVSDGSIPDGADLIGFCFPVYAFGIPRLCRRYLKGLKRFSTKREAFVIITAGDADESGFSVRECEKLLSDINVEVVLTAVVQMPINWIISMNPPSSQEALEIIDKGVSQVKDLMQKILSGTKEYHEFNIPPRYGRFGLYREYLLFRYLGINNLWRSYKVYDDCSGCGLCSLVCPTGSITMADGKPVWSKTCEQCMRCVNYCPDEAIYQSFGGDTRGRNRYLEPSFRKEIKLIASASARKQ